MTYAAEAGRPFDDLVIRSATADDAVMLSAFAARAFHETFAPDNDPHDMQLFLNLAFTPAKQAAELADPVVVYLIVEVAGAMAGYALLRVDSTDPNVSGSRPLELQRFYVDHPWHGRGIASHLMAACVETARERGAVTLWLGVWERNARAIRFYTKHGFTDVGSHDFQLGSDTQTDRVMVRSVTNGN